MKADYPTWTMIGDGGGGAKFYPDNPEDAEHLRAWHGAVPMSERFPWPLLASGRYWDGEDDDEGEPPVRAVVHLSIEVRSRRPLEVSADSLWNQVADRFGRVQDGGPYSIEVAPETIDRPALREEFDFGTIFEGPVRWAPGEAPPEGFHCGGCRVPKEEPRPCPGGVLFRGSRLPCGNPDHQHHEPCAARPAGFPTGGVA